MFDWIQRLRAPRAERKLMAWHALGRPAWSSRDPAAFAREGYARNAIAYRCVRLIAEAAASAPMKVGPADHPLARLLSRPNPEQTGVELLEAFYGHLQVAGNAYLEAASFEEAPPSELYVLRPDRMSVVPGADGWPVGWEHRCGTIVRRFERDPVSNDAPILHLKLFNPTDEWREALQIAAPPFGLLATDARAAVQTATLPHAAKRPWAPAHVRAVRDASGDIAISWIRCARAGGDSWGAGDVPLGEASEAYQLDILDGATVKRSVAVSSPGYTYLSASQIADFGAAPTSLHIRVAQLDSSGTPGLNTELTITL